jgi:hypothetical protein
MIYDHYREVWPQQYPWIPSVTTPCPDPSKHYPPARELTPEEKDRELQKFKDLVERAHKYDKDNKEPDCELESKRKVLKDMAKQLGIEIDFL